jgi:hypothetical protein
MGDGYERVMPNADLNINAPDIESNSPHLSYKVLFENAGTYYLWIRGWADGGADDSMHYGLDGTSISTDFADAIAVSKETLFSEWTTHSGDGSRAIIQVPTTGLHTIDLWMREDGARLDRFLLTTSSSSSSIGDPPESPRHPLLTGDLDTDGDVDLQDVEILANSLSGGQ